MEKEGLQKKKEGFLIYKVQKDEIDGEKLRLTDLPIGTDNHDGILTQTTTNQLTGLSQPQRPTGKVQGAGGSHDLLQKWRPSCRSDPKRRTNVQYYSLEQRFSMPAHR